ncbi:MAG: Nif3-like dinuclear metal center hexameric protein [Phycisphaeraceae bacterium]|nr:MAG: Nif3-like dinuclear metal center hexameric protein [Phycisphaeraceae bacterium]
MIVKDLVRAMQAIAPLEYAEPWDRVGLLVGSHDRPLEGPIVLTIDLTERVLAEAQSAGASAVIAYHPPIWEPLTSVTDRTPQQRIIMRAIELGLAVYAPHTALDAVPGGICDWLCEGLSGSTDGKIAGDHRALQPHPHREPTQEVKIVTFVPHDHLNTLRNALATAGAGIIGHYRVCSFSAKGEGTFLGDENSRPAVGEAGVLQSVDECRLEMVCSKHALPLAVQTLRRFHPYETPAFDIYETLPVPQRDFGPGRRLVLDRPVELPELARRFKAFLGSASVRFADAGHRGPVKTIGVCAGSGNDLAPTARAEGCEVYVTGEMGHHHILASLHAGMSVILGEHTGTERGFLPRLASLIKRHLPLADPIISATDRDPLTPI